MTSEKSPNEADPQGLPAEIEALREKFTDTQQLYREVCALLFFRHGITPTANRLYQLVRKGSMSAPAKALNDFWKTLREKSHMRIEHPDLPVELSAAAGEFVGQIWAHARRAAEAELEMVRSETSAILAEAEQTKNAAQDKSVVLDARLGETEAALSESRDQEAVLKETLALEQSSRIKLESELKHTGELVEELRRNQESQKAGHARELEEQRRHWEKAESRHAVEMKRVEQELAGARQETAKWRAKLEQANLNVAKHTGHQLVRFTKLEAELEKFKQKAALLELALSERNDRRREKSRLAKPSEKRQSLKTGRKSSSKAGES